MLVVFRMLSCLSCVSAGLGERLGIEEAVLKSRRGGRPILVSAVPVGPSIDSWRSRMCLGSICLLFDLCLVVRDGFNTVRLMPITAGFGLWAESSVAMASPLDIWKLLRSASWIICQVVSCVMLALVRLSQLAF